MFNRLLLAAASVVALSGPVFAQAVSYGDDSSEWSNDGECDDPRFVGAAMTQTPLLVEDILADASDCQAGFEAGDLQLIGVTFDAAGIAVVDFGDDASEWANDGECDDPRFAGPGMTQTPLLLEDILHDATDCKAAFDAGNLSLAGTVVAK